MLKWIDKIRTTRFFAFIFLFFLMACEQQEPYTNALLKESSPYLLQHAHNPVNWYPWGQEALDKAKEEEKLLLISIGYSSCHWCHVMERESFEDTTVANLMNQHFVSIKVDREERPDLDAIYMDACQLATGEACGWPLNVFALPDGRPIWAGTYFPKKNWVEILHYFAQVYQDEPEKINTYATQLLRGVRALDSITIKDSKLANLEMAAIGPALEAIVFQMDTLYGGRRGAPKFPSPNLQELLLQWHFYTGNEPARRTVETSLRRMAYGGVYDQLGGGFSRYSVDNQWKVPHFEKMLYDNAQLVSLYAQAYAFTGETDYALRVRETLRFIERRFLGSEGGFYSSLDADSEGEEGQYYVWRQSEMEKLLPDNKWRSLFFEFFQVQPQGNWESGQNILHRQEDLSAFAERHQEKRTEMEKAFDDFKERLLNARHQRPSPAVDDKVLLSWNALMLKAYLDAYHYLEEEAYLETALVNAEFLLANFVQEDGQLFHSYKDKKVSVNAFLDDYAFLIQALIRLYESTFDSQWLQKAEGLVSYVDQHFSDPQSVYYFYTSDLDPELITRKKMLLDNVRPSANSVMAEVLYDLSLLLYRVDYRERSEKMLAGIWQRILREKEPFFYINWMQLYLRMVEPPFEVAIVGPNFRELQRKLMKHYLPHALFLGGANEGNMDLLRGKLRGKETYIYVCKNKTCRLPVQTAADALDQLLEFRKVQ